MAPNKKVYILMPLWLCMHGNKYLHVLKLLRSWRRSLDGTVSTGRESSSSPPVYHAAVTACKSFCRWKWRFRAPISTFISWQLIRAEELTESFGCTVMEQKEVVCPSQRDSEFSIYIYTHTHICTPDYSANVSQRAPTETYEYECLTHTSTTAKPFFCKLWYGLSIPNGYAHLHPQRHARLFVVCVWVSVCQRACAPFIS